MVLNEITWVRQLEPQTFTTAVNYKHQYSSNAALVQLLLTTVYIQPTFFFISSQVKSTFITVIDSTVPTRAATTMTGLVLLCSIGRTVANMFSLPSGSQQLSTFAIHVIISTTNSLLHHVLTYFICITQATYLIILTLYKSSVQTSLNV